MHAPSHHETSPEAQPTRAPERALLTLPWVAALVVLVVNDHALKGSGLLPGALTGKLSDFAGLLLAPALLATLVRARSTQALLACHVAVGLVFAGIQLSLPFAELWSAAMGLLGHPWTITRDPSDLIALPMLLVSWRVLVAKMAVEQPIALELRRLAVAGLSMVGLWSSVATSDVESSIDTNNEWYEDITGNLYVNNANDYDIAVHVRPLRPEVTLDCEQIANDPGRLLPEQAFGEAVHWVLPARTNLPIVANDNLLACSAVWVSGEGVPPMILFWFADDYPATWFAGQTFADEALDWGGSALAFDDQGATWIGGEAFRFAIDTSVPAQDESCVPANEARVDWDNFLPRDRPLELVAIDYGPDGCFELDLIDLWNETSSTAYVCGPESALPFAPGEQLQFSEGGAGGVQRWLTVQRIDPLTGQVLLAADGAPELRVDFLRGTSTIGNLQTLVQVPVTAIPRPSCEWEIDDACASVDRPFELAVVGVEGTLAAGDPTVELTDASGEVVRQLELTLMHARERSLLDSSCIDGATSLGFDLDAVVLNRPAQ